MVDVDSFEMVGMILDNPLNRKAESEDDDLTKSGILKEMLAEAEQSEALQDWKAELDAICDIFSGRAFRKSVKNGEETGIGMLFSAGFLVFVASGAPNPWFDNVPPALLRQTASLALRIPAASPLFLDIPTQSQYASHLTPASRLERSFSSSRQPISDPFL